MSSVVGGCDAAEQRPPLVGGKPESRYPGFPAMCTNITRAHFSLSVLVIVAYFFSSTLFGRWRLNQLGRTVPPSPNNYKIGFSRKLFRKHGIIPKFRRVYEMSTNETNCLTCSCKKHVRMGYPCRHVGSVIKNDPTLSRLYGDGFPLHSVNVFWQLEYYRYGMSTTRNHVEIRKTLQALSRNVIRWVSFVHRCHQLIRTMCRRRLCNYCTPQPSVGYLTTMTL